MPWYEAFWELSTERASGFDAGPIPKRAIDEHISGWPDDGAEVFRGVIRAMDSVYLAIVNKTGEEVQQPQNARDAFRTGTVGRRK